MSNYLTPADAPLLAELADEFADWQDEFRGDMDEPVGWFFGTYMWVHEMRRDDVEVNLRWLVDYFVEHTPWAPPADPEVLEVMLAALARERWELPHERWVWFDRSRGAP